MVINDYIGLIGFSGVAFGIIFTLALVLNSIFLLSKRFTITWLSKTLAWVVCICLSLAVFSLCTLLLTNAFEFPLVFDSVEKGMPWLQKLGGLWSWRSKLFNVLEFHSFSGNCLCFKAIQFCHPLTNLAVIIITLGFSLMFFLIPVLVISNPFGKSWQMTNGVTAISVFQPENSGLIVPVDGVGMELKFAAYCYATPSAFFVSGFSRFFHSFCCCSCSIN